MRRANATRERGAALLALLAVLMLGASWFLVSQLNADSGSMVAVKQSRNAAALNRAKQALIGYVAMKAAEAGENNPGRLPCPEAVNNVGTTSEGISAPMVTPATPSCSSVGRLPWRTLGLEKLYDAAGEPLWYVVGPAWRLSTSASTLLINSNTAGDTTVDGQQVVALIIAPGSAMNVQATAGCTARNQSRSAPAPAMDARDYLECFDSGTLQFVTTASSSSYNDQAVRVTVADIMPAIEAAIANRIEREILPALQTVYTPSAWGFSGSNPAMPFAAAFASPGPGAGTSNYRGAAGTYQGLLPFNQRQGCTESAADPRCTTAITGGTALHVFSKPAGYVDARIAGTGAVRTSSNSSTCVWLSSKYVCTGEYDAPSISVSVSVNITNIAMGLRSFNSSLITCSAVDDVGSGLPSQTVTCSASVALQSDGSAIVTATTSALPDISASGWGTYANYKVSFDPAAFGDHALLSTTNATTGWFARNEWYRLVYYAVSQGNTAAQLPSERSCTTPGNCLTIANVTPASRSAALILAGRSVNGIARPSATLADYLEFGNTSGALERQSVTPVVATIYADTGTANAYTVDVTTLATGASFQFRALSANTGNSNLSTAATGTRSLVNRDLSNLAAATIQANAAVEVTWDGTQFLLSRRPYNDRIASIASN